MRYGTEAHIYCSAQPSVFFYIVLNVDVSNFYFLNGPIKYLLCAVVVTASCLISSEKNETLHGAVMILWTSLFLSVVSIDVHAIQV